MYSRAEQWIVPWPRRGGVSLGNPRRGTSRDLRQNWNRIEQMARDFLARECFEDGRINPVMI